MSSDFKLIARTVSALELASSIRSTVAPSNGLKDEDLRKMRGILDIGAWRNLRTCRTRLSTRTGSRPWKKTESLPRLRWLASNGELNCAAKDLVSHGRERLACEKRQSLFHPLGEK